MKFNKRQYVILDDIGDKSVLLSPGLLRFMGRLSKSKSDIEKEVELSFGAFYQTVINNCKKGYYLSKKIFELLTEDIEVQNKLQPLLHELEPAQGIMLLPIGSSLSPLNAISYAIGREPEYPNELLFSIGFHSQVGMEFYSTGGFQGTKFRAANFSSDDLDFGIDQSIVIENYINFMMNLLLFMQFAEIETVISHAKDAPGRSIVKINKNKYENDSKITIEVIDSNWFRRLIRKGAFKVRGHFRLQPYGPNYSLRKLIWIEDFEKSSYTVNPKKLKNNEAS
ncbi:MAG: hypothetical protein H6581_16320 [Bacteroidia bacterium]|nr:hypothetical protein [Bacteroidia bacterium]